MKRRKMLETSVLAFGGLCTCSLASADGIKKSDCCFTPELETNSYRIAENDIQIDLDKAGTVNSRGYAAFIINKEHNLNMILVHDKYGKFHCMERFCTHGGRALSFVKERGLLQCNNFNHSTFELNGAVFNGPAPASLNSYDVRKEKNLLHISF